MSVANHDIYDMGDLSCWLRTFLSIIYCNYILLGERRSTIQATSWFPWHFINS